ncbi:hypothetical protein ADUPG1_011453 [Aduncisulcus paluster]|uniref:Uncharacterized protein n=1 Tax=Aduncisulcus paluster TaxID=2918883 RepID=A0ABQ5JVY6_9EUKA|nr:hypothetical protein ADUPG1_011453 [Aduncisulcus paluster]
MSHVPEASMAISSMPSGLYACVAFLAISLHIAGMYGVMESPADAMMDETLEVRLSHALKFTGECNLIFEMRKYVGTREYLDERVKALERNANYFKESCFFLSLDVLRTSESPTRFGVFTVFEKGCVKILKDSTSSGILPYTQKALKGKALTYLSIPPSGAKLKEFSQFIMMCWIRKG